ncbi:putative phage abortive infection protein [Bacillus luti]|uniref:putative phage abortive infection protein n=1 Tax=Bacillus luti TaxID=2026191 RepID=UPI003D03B679
MANKDNDKKENTERWAKFFTWIGFALVPIAVAMPFIVYYFDFSYLKELGAVGDFIGGTTVTFLTGASVFLLIATNIMQRKELENSRESINQLVEQTAASIQQAEEARKETQITNETMKKQQFETTFFNMLQLHHQIVDGIKVKLPKKHEDGVLVETYSGREAIFELRDICKWNIITTYYPEAPLKRTTEYEMALYEVDGGIDQENLDLVYEHFQKHFGNNIGHYMRNNYRIVKFIVENVADNEEEQKEIKEKIGRDAIIGDKRFYFGTLRAQWSDAEFELILINLLYGKNHKFKKLIKQHDVLDIKETDEEILKNKPEGSFVLKEDMIAFIEYKILIEND